MLIAIIAIVGLGALAYGLWWAQPDKAPQMMMPIGEKELTEKQHEMAQIKKRLTS